MAEEPERTWATGSAYDNKPLDWLFDLRYDKDVTHIQEALQAVTTDPDAGIGKCQTALLAAECVAFLQGAPADLHEDARSWLDRGTVSSDQALVDLTLQAIEQVSKQSSLKEWWEEFRKERAPGWLTGVKNLQQRVEQGENFAG